MVNDPIGDMLIRIKNAYLARLGVVEVPTSRVKMTLAKLLADLGYVAKVNGETGRRVFAISLKYEDGIPALTGVERLSKPGLRYYVGVKDLVKLRRGLGYLILSTPKGLKTNVEAQKEGVGGELLCRVW